MLPSCTFCSFGQQLCDRSLKRLLSSDFAINLSSNFVTDFTSDVMTNFTTNCPSTYTINHLGMTNCTTKFSSNFATDLLSDFATDFTSDVTNNWVPDQLLNQFNKQQRDQCSTANSATNSMANSTTARPTVRPIVRPAVWTTARPTILLSLRQTFSPGFLIGWAHFQKKIFNQLRDIRFSNLTSWEGFSICWGDTRWFLSIICPLLWFPF